MITPPRTGGPAPGLLLLAMLGVLLACTLPSRDEPPLTATASTSSPAPAAPSAVPVPPTVAPSSAPPLILGRSPEAFRDLMEKLSEADAHFISDNFVSNETSYLQIADQLRTLPGEGGVYIGVGPEQNFTYIALTEPTFAYVVDIRRDNLVLHLLYKAVFDEATSRAHFLSLLTARPYDGSRKLPDDASLAEVLARVDESEPSEESFVAAHTMVRRRIEDGYGIALTDSDKKSMRRAHRVFFDKGLDLSFKLKEQSFRRYPSMRELLAARSPKGDALGYLATDVLFRRVQKMQRENRILPLVGNFGGDHALPRLAEHLEEEKLTVRAFYVSNVEQYLMVDGLWWKWQRNVAALPTDEHSVFIRCYFDQGSTHPLQMKGHRTTTTVHRIADFLGRKAPYPTMLAAARDRPLR